MAEAYRPIVETDVSNPPGKEVMPQTTRVILTAFVAAAIGATSCSTAPKSPPQTPAPAPAIPYTFVWSADPGVDLFSRGSELVRATDEAARYTLFVGVAKSYTGYAQAVSDLTTKYDFADNPDGQIARNVARTPWHPNDMRPETVYSHITAFTESDAKVTAIVCDYEVTPNQSSHDSAQRVVSGGTAIELENTNSAPGKPGIANRDPSHQDPRAHIPPQWDIFGSWKVTNISTPLDGKSSRAECIPWLEQQFPGFAKIPSNPYNFLQSPPGYKEAHHPVAPQFPEWIGPS